MKHFESAFLGLILAGVLMMVIGLSLLMTSARSDSARPMLAEGRATAQARSMRGHRAARERSTDNAGSRPNVNAQSRVNDTHGGTKTTLGR